MVSPRLNFPLSNVYQSVKPFVPWIVKACRQAGDNIIFAAYLSLLSLDPKNKFCVTARDSENIHSDNNTGYLPISPRSVGKPAV